MKRYIFLIALIVFSHVWAMDQEQDTCSDLASTKPIMRNYVRTLCIRKGRGTVYASVLGFMTACSVVEIKRKGRSYVVKVACPTRLECGLVVDFERIDHKLDDAIPGNSTLWETGPDSYDVLYRREDGVCVAKELETGQELYHIKHERTEGDDQEQLVQSADGWVIMTNKDGSYKTWLHPELKNRVLIK